MKTFTKNILTKTMALTMFTAISSSAFAVTNTASIGASATIQQRLLVTAPGSLTLNIDPTTDSGTKVVGDTTNNFCVFSNISNTPKYTISVDGVNSKLLGQAVGNTTTVLPYTIKFEQGASNVTYIVNGTALTASTTQLDAIKDRANCRSGSVSAGGKASISISESVWGTALADTYSGTVSVTVTSA